MDEIQLPLIVSGSALAPTGNYYLSKAERKKETTRKWRTTHPEKVREYKRRRRAANPEKGRKEERKWRLTNREKVKKGNRKRYLANRGKINKKSKKWRTNHPERAKEIYQKYAVAVFERWMEMVIIPRGMNRCSRCGYSGNFAAIDFHHCTSGEKGLEPSKIMQRKITPARIKEIEKCIALCANCHREEHERIRTESGKDKKWKN